MCCFLLHDILKMKFEDLNVMRCCAKPNKYYQYICKIGSVKFDRGRTVLVVVKQIRKSSSPWSKNKQWE